MMLVFYEKTENNKMKVLIVSINDKNENTGGGIYLRTLIKLYKLSGCNVDVFSKNSSDYKVKKNIFTDLLGRLFLCPSYIGFYILKILIISNKYDVIAIHSGRLGMLLKFLKIVYKKRIIIHTDNVELSLINQISYSGNYIKDFVIKIDKFLIPISERIIFSTDSLVTFITEEDRDVFHKLGYITEYDKNKIIPVLLDGNKTRTQTRKNNSILFTGSFDFYPNQHALQRLMNVALKNEDVDFIVAGRGLASYLKANDIIVPNNITTYSDISAENMHNLYAESKAFICPVYYGSGMKTKIAEALSYNLYVIADEVSCQGYSKAIEQKVVYTLPSDFFDNTLENALSDFINTILNSRMESSPSPVDVFTSQYSLESGLKRFGEILK